MKQVTGFVPSANRQPIKPNQLTDISGVKVTICPPGRARGTERSKMRAKGVLTQDLNLMTRRYTF